MKQSGRVNIIMLGGLVGVAVIAFFAMFSGESASVAATRFMSALASRDINTLVATSYIEKASPEEIRKEWEYCINVANPNYVFEWSVLGEVQPDDKSASVRLDVKRDASSPASYGEKFGLPLVKIDNKWMVDVRSIDRDMYPFLPH